MLMPLIHLSQTAIINYDRQVYTREDCTTLLLPWLLGMLGVRADDGAVAYEEAAQASPPCWCLPCNPRTQPKQPPQRDAVTEQGLLACFSC